MNLQDCQYFQLGFQDFAQFIKTKSGVQRIEYTFIDSKMANIFKVASQHIAGTVFPFFTPQPIMAVRLLFVSRLGGQLVRQATAATLSGLDLHTVILNIKRV